MPVEEISEPDRPVEQRPRFQAEPNRTTRRVDRQFLSPAAAKQRGPPRQGQEIELVMLARAGGRSDGDDAAIEPCVPEQAGFARWQGRILGENTAPSRRAAAQRRSGAVRDWRAISGDGQADLHTPACGAVSPRPAALAWRARQRRALAALSRKAAARLHVLDAMPVSHSPVEAPCEHDCRMTACKNSFSGGWKGLFPACWTGACG